MTVNYTERIVRLSVVAVILVSCVGCDQFTKHVAQSRLKGQPAHSYLGDMFRLQYVENPGAFLGLGGQIPDGARMPLLVGLNVVISLGLIAAIAFAARMTRARVIGCALLLAGAVGNLIDRMRFDGLVVDFMNLGVGPLRSGIFNVADMAIMAGALLLVLPAIAPANAGPSSDTGVTG
jgi:signal peptidase II